MQKPTLLSLAALSLVLAAPLLAAPVQAAPGAHAGKRLQKLTDELSLTDAQKAQMGPVLQNARQQVKAIQNDATLTPDAKTAKIKALRKSTNRQTLAILTPDQRAKLKSIRQAKREAKQGTA